MEQIFDKMFADIDQMNNTMDEKLLKVEKTDESDDEEDPGELFEFGNSYGYNAVFDSGATSGVAVEKDAQHLISIGKKSNKIFVIPNCDSMTATERMKLPFELREPATDMSLVPGVHTSLISAVKFAEADYISVLYKDGLKIYDGKSSNIAKILIKEKAVLEGYRTNDGL